MLPMTVHAMLCAAIGWMTSCDSACIRDRGTLEHQLTVPNFTQYIPPREPWP